MRRLVLLLTLLGLATPARAEVGSVGFTDSLPMSCAIGSLTYLTTGSAGLYLCTATNTWSAVAGTGGGVPSGGIIFVASGTCPASYTEVAGLDGHMIRGTVAANMNVGGTGGSDSYTPAGTTGAPALTMNSYTPAGTISALTLVGTAWTPPAIAWPAGVPTYTGTVNTLAVTAHTLVSTKQGSSAGNVVTTATHVITGIPGGTVAWPAGVPTIGAYTPAGTIATPSFTGTPATLTGSVAAPSFTGTSATVTPAYLRLIGCAKT